MEVIIDLLYIITHVHENGLQPKKETNEVKLRDITGTDISLYSIIIIMCSLILFHPVVFRFATELL